MAKENGDSQFGFKDKAKAEETLSLLEEHDMQYRKLTVRGLLGRAKRVLTSKFLVFIYLFGMAFLSVNIFLSRSRTSLTNIRNIIGLSSILSLKMNYN